MDPDRWVTALQAEGHGARLVLGMVSNPVTRSGVRLVPPIEISGPADLSAFSDRFYAACTAAWNHVPRVDLTELDASDWRGGQHAVV